jgi:hypothetical protein
LEVKPSIWEALEVFELFCEGLTKVAHYNPKKKRKRTLNFEMHPHWYATSTN